MKVMIYVKNKTGKTLNNISVVDRIPKSIKKPTEFGNYTPETITNMGESTRLAWVIPSLRKKQEKIISYKISSKIKVTGKLNLPNALARVRKGKRSFKASSKKEAVKEM